MAVTVDRDRIAIVLDAVVATLAGSERLDESRRWALAALLTEVRMSVDDLTEPPSGVTGRPTYSEGERT